MSGLYVPPRNRDTVATSLGKISMEDIMAKFFKGVE